MHLWQTIQQHQGYQDVYTDGSKANDTVAAAAVYGQHVLTKRLPDEASVFSAELLAIMLALKLIVKKVRGNAIIFSDSKSSLQALSQSDPDSPIVAGVRRALLKVQRKYDILFCWIPSHIGITGNEKADKEAKDALSSDVDSWGVVASDVKSKINKYIKTKHQERFDNINNNKLKDIQPQVRQTPHMTASCRRDEVVLTRLKIGHTHPTHSFLLKGEDPPFCIGCHEFYTVKHLLLDCVDTQHIREKYFNVQSLCDLFSSVPYQK